MDLPFSLKLTFLNDKLCEDIRPLLVVKCGNSLNSFVEDIDLFLEILIAFHKLYNTCELHEVTAICLEVQFDLSNPERRRKI